MSKLRDQVFSRPFPSPKGPQVITISIRLCSFLAAIPEGPTPHVTSQYSYFSGDSACGSLVCASNEAGFFGGWWEAAVVLQVCSGALVSSAKHAYIPDGPHVALPAISSLRPSKGIRHEIFAIMPELPESDTCLQRPFLRMFSLSTYWRVQIRKESQAGSNGICGR